MNPFKKAKSEEDEKYILKFTQEPWLTKNDLVNIDLIQDHLPSFKYFYEQNDNLEHLCTEKVFKQYYQSLIYFSQKMPKI